MRTWLAATFVVRRTRIGTVVVESVTAAAGTWNSAVLQDLTVKGLAALGDKFRLHENAEPPEVLLSAAAKDIEATLKRAVGEFLEASK